MSVYTESYIRAILRNWYYIKARNIINDSYIATWDIEDALEDAFLNEQDLEIAEYMKLGYSDKEIAALKDVSRKTIYLTRRELERVITSYLNPLR